jgi:hypothetical protein
MSSMILIRRNDVARRGRYYWFLLGLLALPVSVLAQGVEAPTQDKGEKKAALPNAGGNNNRQRDVASQIRHGHGALKPFYDVSFHSVPDSSAVNLSDYLVDQRFWGRKPTLVVVTPVYPNVLQADEGHAEALTEALLRQIAADLGVREVHDKVSQTIGFLRKLGKKARSGEAESNNGSRSRVEQAGAEQAKTDETAEPANAATQQVDARGLRVVQLILLPDVRPIWNGMSLFDRNAVVDRSLHEYLKKVPIKRERMLEYLEPDQFRFAAFAGKEAGNELMDSLGIRRPEMHFLICDRNGEVVGSWTKSTFDAKKISAAYRALLKEANQRGE